MYVTQTDVARRLLLISSSLPCASLLVAASRFDVHTQPFDLTATDPKSLLDRIETACSGQLVTSIGLACTGKPGSAAICRGLTLTAKELRKPEVKAFWQGLRQHIASRQDGGRLDFFVAYFTDSGTPLFLSVFMYMPFFFLCFPPCLYLLRKDGDFNYFYSLSQ